MPQLEKTDREMPMPLATKKKGDEGSSQVASTFSTCHQNEDLSARGFLKRDHSMYRPTGYKIKSPSADDNMAKLESSASQSERDSPGATSASLKSDRSMIPPIIFKDGDNSPNERFFQEDQPVISFQNQKLDRASIFMMLQEKIVSFVKTELDKLQRVLSSEFDFKSEDQDPEEGEPASSSRHAFLKITLDFLRIMKQEQLAESLLSKTRSTTIGNQMKSFMRKRHQHVYEGLAKTGNPTPLNKIFTEVFVTMRGNTNEHEIRQIERNRQEAVKSEVTVKAEDIFRLSCGDKQKSVRTVLTQGVAGIGKTILTHKVTLDWAEGKCNKDVQFMLPMPFRELNLVKDKEFSLVELIHHFFVRIKEAGICNFEEFQVLFIFDGLDECRLRLDFQNNEILTDVKQPASVDVLLTNIIRGNLLPTARLWITTRPAAGAQIPPECVDRLTEIRGFTDQQKEEYFRLRFKDEQQANRIISHVKASQSLYVMCHIPIFCWITSTVCEEALKTIAKSEFPRTLTEMHIHFLGVQLNLKKAKYDAGAGKDIQGNLDTRKMIIALGKLAFEHLRMGNMIFYESDVAECGLDIKAASVHSGVFTQIFKEERSLYKDKVFSFVHLSVQEFLAAVYVHLIFTSSGVNLLSDKKIRGQTSAILKNTKAMQLYHCAVKKALDSPTGHLDLFLRFLVGLSVESNQMFLQDLIGETRVIPKTNDLMAKYIKTKLRKNLSPERSINLFQCLSELNDHTLVEEIQQYMKSGNLATKDLSPAHWSALGFILLSSGGYLDVFNLKEYSLSEQALLRLLPVVKASRKAVLADCNLSQRICKMLGSDLSSSLSCLKELDLSNNDLQDSGVQLLAAGLNSPHCILETLSLSGCMVTEKGCMVLVNALRANPSHLRALDMNYNHPGEVGKNQLTKGLQDPLWRLESLSMDHCGWQRLRPGLRKYACELTLDGNTANCSLELSDCDRMVRATAKEHPYPDHPDRFTCHQLLCRENLTGRHFWVAEWKGWVSIGVAYKGIGRGNRAASWLGKNPQSWSLKCSEGGYSVWHNNKEIAIQLVLKSKRVAVYVDCPAGTLSFYAVTSSKLHHLHTFTTTFTEPLYPGFLLYNLESSVSLRQKDDSIYKASNQAI